MAQAPASTASLKNKLAEKANAPAVRPVAAVFKDFIKDHRGDLMRSLPTHAHLDKLEMKARSAINRTPLLGQCTTASIIYSFITSIQLGLEINTPLGHAYLIPYKRSQKVGNEWVSSYEAQFQLGVQGIIDLALRTAKFKTIQVKHVYANDDLQIAYGSGGYGRMIPAMGDRGEFTGVFAYYQLVDGGEDFLYWSKEQIETHAKRYSKSWIEKDKAWQKGSAWGENFEGMAPVPVLKQLLKFAPKSIELAQQLALDGTIRHSSDQIAYLNGDDSAPTMISMEDVSEVVDKSTGEVTEVTTDGQEQTA